MVANFAGSIFCDWRTQAVIHDFIFVNGPVPTIY